MSLNNLLSRPVTGIRAFNGLPLDELKWNEAQNHHHLHRRLHLLAGHRPGIIYGLEVIATDGTTVVVAPGVGIDADGQVLVLTERTALSLREADLCYIVLAYREIDDPQSEVAVYGGGNVRYRVVESQDLMVVTELPSRPFLELARVDRSDTDRTVREPANEFDPKRDELNMLHRQVAFPHCYADLAVGEISYIPDGPGAGGDDAWKPNRAGLWNLMREGNGRGFHLDFAGLVSLSEDAAPVSRPPALLYVAGSSAFFPFPDEEVEQIGRLLDAGSVLFGEDCTGGTGGAFAKSFLAMAAKLGMKLRAVTAGHPLLSAHYVFPMPPVGANATGQLLASEDGAVVFSTYDYGGAWQGTIKGVDDPTGARERVRTAQEFGLNVSAWAARRRRTRELARLK